MTSDLAAFYRDSPPSSLIFHLAFVQAKIDRGMQDDATPEEQKRGERAYERRALILASKPLRAALAHFTDLTFHNACDGRTWLIHPGGLRAYSPPDAVPCARFDEPIPTHPGVRADRVPVRVLAEVY